MLNEEQKRFLQYLLHCPLMSVKELQKKHAICFELDRGICLLNFNIIL